MSFQYEYYFVEKGTTREQNTEMVNELWIDVGGYIREGIFDHHNSEKDYHSTLDILLHERELLRQTKEKLVSSQKVRIFLHVNPDIDALFSCYALEYFLDHSEEEFDKIFANDSFSEKILQYVNDIDEGLRKNAEKATLYNMVCHLHSNMLKEKWNITNNIDLSNKIVETAFRWIEIVIRCMEEDTGFNIYDGELPVAKEDSVAKEIIDSVIQEGKANYERDKKKGTLIIKDIFIWKKDGTKAKVKAAIWNDIPLSPETSYIYARKEGAVVTFVPHHDSGIRGVKVSINPNIENAVEEYSLLEVAEIYEQMEQIYDKRCQDEKGFLPRDYSKPRGTEEEYIFLRKPFSATSDPWYVSKKADMVDSPGKGSRIPVLTLIEILENITKMVKKTYLVNFDLKISEKKEIPIRVERFMKEESLLFWTERIKKLLPTKQNEFYTLAIAEVDSSLISHHYEILDAYFMNLFDENYMEAEGKNVFRLDYRTHLYVNQASAVLFIATSDRISSQTQMDGMLNWSSDKSLTESTIVQVFSKILFQREKYKELGRFLRDFRRNVRRIKQKNEELILLLANAQADECIDNQVELDTFEFVYDALDVEKLRNSVKDTMNIVSEYSQERAFANINFLSMITIPFLLISSLFQMGMVQFKPIFDATQGGFNVGAIIAWMIFFVLVIVVTILLMFFRRRK